MIRILDTMTLIHLCADALYVREEHACYVPLDIEEEFLGNSKNDAWFKKNYFLEERIDDAEYLTEYAHYLNRYSGVNFYSLKGFGDVAILAVLGILVKAAPPTLSLSEDIFPHHSIRLVTNDRTLGNFVRRVFAGRVVVEGSASFASNL